MVTAEAESGVGMKSPNPVMALARMMQATSWAISTISALRAMSVKADCLVRAR